MPLPLDAPLDGLAGRQAGYAGRATPPTRLACPASCARWILQQVAGGRGQLKGRWGAGRLKGSSGHNAEWLHQHPTDYSVPNSQCAMQLICFTHSLLPSLPY